MSVSLKIVVVAQAPAILQVAETVLRRAGYDLVAVAEAMQALAIMREVCPDLVLVEHELPQMTGIDFCRRLKSGHAPQALVALLTPTNGLAEEWGAAQAAGIDGFITIPLGSAELLAQVAAFERLIRANNLLQQRLARVECISAIAQAAQRDQPLNDLIHTTLNRLPLALRYPEAAIPLIELDGKRYLRGAAEADLADLPEGLHAPLWRSQQICGRIAVFYRADHTFLLPDEQQSRRNHR
jgi:CheY-like chemotaxis protein